MVETMEHIVSTIQVSAARSGKSSGRNPDCSKDEADGSAEQDFGARGRHIGAPKL
ncbi:MAG TPA: hypothetical protein VGK48_09690 [Terriglobia bacterium]|jgi:hypothetical protein